MDASVRLKHEAKIAEIESQRAVSTELNKDIESIIEMRGHGGETGELRIGDEQKTAPPDAEIKTPHQEKIKV
jgi:hypothetical protein